MILILVYFIYNNSIQEKLVQSPVHYFISGNKLFIILSLKSFWPEIRLTYNSTYFKNHLKAISLT